MWLCSWLILLFFHQQIIAITDEKSAEFPFMNCLETRNYFFPSSSFWKTNYLPTIVFSYQYRPKQTYPTTNNRWYLDGFFDDLLRENHEPGSVHQNLLNGERHQFWVALRFDFKNFFIDQESQKRWQMFKKKSQINLEKMQQEYFAQMLSEFKEENLTQMIDRISHHEKIKAQIAYHCQPSDG